MFLGLVIISILFVSTVEGKDFSQFTICCQHCRADQDLWVTFTPSWDLTIGDSNFLDFISAPSVLTNSHIARRAVHNDRDYYIRYGGAAVQMLYTSTENADLILDQQFLQIDLESVLEVGGLRIQAGFYEDVNDILFYKRSSWITSFMVSYSSSPDSFTYMLDSDGNPKVYDGTYDSVTSSLASFDGTVAAQYIRIHPLEAFDENGQTDEALFRATVVTCSKDDYCYNPRVNCIMFDWGEWSECSCNGFGFCHQWRVREVAHHAACGGVECGVTKERRSCVTIKSSVEDALKWGLIVMALLLIIVVLVIILVCYYKKKREERLIFDKSKAKKLPKEEKNRKKEERKVREDIEEKKHEETENEKDEKRAEEAEFNEFDENVLTPREVHMEDEAPKESTPKVEKKAKKTKKSKKFKNDKKKKATDDPLNDSGITSDDANADFMASPSQEQIDAMFGTQKSNAGKKTVLSNPLELAPIRGAPSLGTEKDHVDDFNGILDESKA